MRDEDVPRILLRILTVVGICAATAYAHGLFGAVCNELELVEMHSWASSVSTALTFLMLFGLTTCFVSYLSFAAHARELLEWARNQRREQEASRVLMSAAPLPPQTEKPSLADSATETAATNANEVRTQHSPAAAVEVRASP